MRKNFTRDLLVGAGIAALVMPPCMAMADGHSEIVVAAQHAEYAAKSALIAGVHMHLHHTLNCLVGPNGQGFDSKELNPCANSGNGAIPDTADTMHKQALESAADKAREGIAAGDYATAQKDAEDTEEMLKKDE